MPVCEFKIEYSKTETKACAAVAIIVAAGSSARMQGVNKQFAEICGMPLIARTLSVFEESPFVSRIILVSKGEDIPKMQEICSKYLFEKVTDIVEGGSTRQESVLNGFKRLGKDENAVIIHDGARPFVSGEMISDVVTNLPLFDCVTCAVKIVDTVKSADEEGMVKKTVDRSGLYLSQTPQAVKKDVYLSVLEMCENYESFTDDASIMESAGKTVKLVSGSRKNIKVTTKEDLALAEIFVKGEGLCE